MAPSKSLLSLLLSFLLVVMLVTKVDSQTQGTIFIIHTFTPNSSRLTYEGDAHVPPNNRYVRLVPRRRPHSAGRVLFNTPVTLWTTGWQASFHTTITLQMTPLSGGTDFGFGFTFFMVPVNSTVSSVGFGNNLGIYDVGTPIFAVELDNGRGNSNPDYPHIGININSQRSQNVTRAEGMVGQRVTVYISYDPRIKTITAVATYGTRTATVSFVIDLVAILPQQVQVGLSASTGSPTYTDLDAYFWEFISGMVPDVIGTRKNDTDIKPYVM